MPNRREEFRVLMERQMNDLHRRMVELEQLASHPGEHTISYDTVTSEARAKHLAAVARLRELDEQADDRWHASGEEIRTVISELQRAVEEEESKRA